MNEELLPSDVLRCLSEFAHLAFLCADLTGSQTSYGLTPTFDDEAALGSDGVEQTSVRDGYASLWQA
ncbi:hypothetical protein GB937_000939 [Aspergillus fischeri]|nr:hypothetical protein GB937_000939 [Aspergillus fischeri]